MSLQRVDSVTWMLRDLVKICVWELTFNIIRIRMHLLISSYLGKMIQKPS